MTSNIPKVVLTRIENKISGLLKELQDVIHWSDNNLKKETRKKTTYELKKARRKLKRIKGAITRRPSAALFGESQVGKSYLIKTFLSDEKGKFDITDAQGNKVSFLEEINPKGGGVESTSVVCRFSTRISTPDQAFPLVGKLLTVKEIILVLCDTYFNDVKNHNHLPDSESINEKINQLKDFFSTSDYHQEQIEEDDVYEIKEYLEEHFRSYIGNLMHSEYWDVLANLIHRIDDENWFLAFDILFGKNEYIEEIFNKLVGELKRLEYPREVYLEFDAVLRKHGTILNVARLRELNDGPQYSDVAVKSDFKEDVMIGKGTKENWSKGKINKSALCALLAEISFKVETSKEEDVVFLKHSDLLDFPGAQPRLENNEKDVAGKHISEMVLRGKVGYLFNKYSAQYLINNLLLCHHNRDLKAKSIASLIDTWINNFIGNTPEDREAFLKSTAVPPLFKIFTFFNVDLAFDSVNDQDPTTYPTKWTKRLHTIFEKQIVNSASFNWNEQWTFSKPFFTNNYLLRDIHHSREIFNRNEDESEETEYVTVKLDHDYYKEVKKSFTKSELVQKYFDHPENAWDAAASSNLDGSQLILKNLSSVSTNYLKTTKFVKDINDTLSLILKEIEKHFQSKDADEQIIQANKNADQIKLNLDIIFGSSPSSFGHFVKKFTIKENEVYEFYREQLNTIDRSKHRNFNEYVAIRNNCQHLSMNGTYEENMKVLLSTYSNLSTEEEAELYFTSKGINLKYLFFGDDSVNIKNNSQILAEGILDYWFEHNLQLKNFQFIIDKGFPEESLEKLFENIKISCKKHMLHEVIANEIRQYVDRIEKIDEIIFMIADITAGIINKYFNSMGWDYYGEEEKNRILTANEANDLKLRFERLENKLEYESNESIAALFDEMQNYNEELSKTVPNSEVINRYPNFWNFNKWSEQMKISFVANCDIPTYDVRANRNLGDLIENLKGHQFEVTTNSLVGPE